VTYPASTLLHATHATHSSTLIHILAIVDQLFGQLLEQLFDLTFDSPALMAMPALLLQLRMLLLLLLIVLQLLHALLLHSA
jgi:hypothetical protein